MIVPISVPNNCVLFGQNTQPGHDIKAKLHGRCYDVKTLKKCRNNVVLTSCAGWVPLVNRINFNSSTDKQLF